MENLDSKVTRTGAIAILRSPHLWIIVIVVLALSYLYYVNLIFGKNTVEWVWYITVTEYRLKIHGSLFYIPIFYSAIAFGWKGITAVWLSSIAIILPRAAYYAPDSGALSVNILFLTAPIVIILLLISLWKWRQKEKKTLAEREAERQIYLSGVFKAHEEERKRIAQALHDDTIQTLLAMASNVQSLINIHANQLPSQVTQQLESFRDSTFHISDELRKLSIDLRPSILDDLGLLDALSWLGNKMNDNSMAVRLNINGTRKELAPDAEVIIFRFIQEALNNAKRHSEATKVEVNVNFGDENVSIRVQDNGKGFVLQNPARELVLNGKLGITGMQEKASFLGGTFDISSEPGKGTVVSMEFKAC